MIFRSLLTQTGLRLMDSMVPYASAEGSAVLACTSTSHPAYPRELQLRCFNGVLCPISRSRPSREDPREPAAVQRDIPQPGCHRDLHWKRVWRGGGLGRFPGSLEPHFSSVLPFFSRTVDMFIGDTDSTAPSTDTEVIPVGKGPC